MPMNKARWRRSPRAPRSTTTWNSSASSSPEGLIGRWIGLHRGVVNFWVPDMETWGGPIEKKTGSCQERDQENRLKTEKHTTRVCKVTSGCLMLDDFCIFLRCLPRVGLGRVPHFCSDPHGHLPSFVAIPGGGCWNWTSTTGWWFGTFFVFFHMTYVNVIIPTDELIFSRGVQTTKRTMFTQHHIFYLRQKGLCQRQEAADDGKKTHGGCDFVIWSYAPPVYHLYCWLGLSFTLTAWKLETQPFWVFLELEDCTWCDQMGSSMQSPKSRSTWRWLEKSLQRRKNYTLWLWLFHVAMGNHNF